MGGGLMQLVAYGAQDIYLTGNPQITFFKVVYRRHTNFSMECISQTFNGTIGVNASNVTATISRNGDLVGAMHLDVFFPDTGAVIAAGPGSRIQWVNNTGHAYIDTVELEIGGQRIDRHYGHWLDVWDELTEDDFLEKQSLLNKSQAAGFRPVPGGVQQTSPGSLKVYVPLKFWFNRNPGLALPLIALQYHEVKVKLQTRSLAGLLTANQNLINPLANAPACNLWVDYIYLDTDERRRFAQQSHEYLIEQLQYQSDSVTGDIKLNLNHPVKELIWTMTSNVAATEVTAQNGARNRINAPATKPIAQSNVTAVVNNQGNDYFRYDLGNNNRGVGAAEPAATGAPNERIGGNFSPEAFDTFLLKLNGHDRFAAKKASYFRTVQTSQHGHRVPNKHVYCYSFALKPEEHQPSGTCNFSRIDNARMVFTALGGAANTETFNIYAVNYNVLRIMSGMGGLAYSN